MPDPLPKVGVDQLQVGMFVSLDMPWLDHPFLLSTFIKELGIYPPGSFVRLSTGSIAIVVAVTRGSTLKPTVLVYEPGVPRRDALVLSLADSDEVTIDAVLKPRALPREVVDYLNPRMNLAYFAQRAHG